MLGRFILASLSLIFIYYCVFIMDFYCVFQVLPYLLRLRHDHFFSGNVFNDLAWTHLAHKGGQIIDLELAHR